jgi:hypothetical protein
MDDGNGKTCPEFILECNSNVIANPGSSGEASLYQMVDNKEQIT